MPFVLVKNFKNKFNYIINSFLWVFLISFIFSYLIRLIAFIFFENNIHLPDSENYIVESVNILTGNNLYDSFYLICCTVSMPLYSIWLTIPISFEILFNDQITFDNIFSETTKYLTFFDGDNDFYKNIRLKIFIFDNFLSSAQPFFLYVLSRLIFRNNYISFLSCIIYTCYPLSVFYATITLTENLFSFLLLLGLIFLYSKRILIASVFFVLSILVRPTFELAYPIIIVYFSYFYYDKKFICIIKNLFIFSLVYTILFIPWWIFNYNRYHQFVRLHPNFGLLLYAGNNSLNTSGGGIVNKDFDLAQFDDVRYHNPIVLDKKLTKEALNYIKHNKKKFLKNSFKKFKRFYRITPYSESISKSIRYIYTISYLPILILSILSLFYLKRKYFFKLIPIFYLIFWITLIHTITFASVRYRFPIESFMIILSSFYLYGLFTNFILKNIND